jgi:hypothetical protein
MDFSPAFQRRELGARAPQRRVATTDSEFGRLLVRRLKVRLVRVISWFVFRCFGKKPTTDSEF